MITVRRSSFTPTSPCPERNPARVPGGGCDCAVKGTSAATDRIKANNFFTGGLIACRCFARLLLFTTISGHLNPPGDDRISASILIPRARKLFVISEHLNTGEVQSPTVARWPVKSSRVIKRRAIGTKWNCVWIDRDSGKFVSGAPPAVAAAGDRKASDCAVK